MANTTPGFELGLGIAALWSVTGITDRMRRNSERRLLGGRLMTVIAILFLAISQWVLVDVIYMLFGIKESVVILACGEITLWWLLIQALLTAVADGTALKRR